MVRPGKESGPKKPGIDPDILAEFAEKFCKAEAFFILSGMTQLENGLLSISTD
jgi:hypothetical protein